MRIRRFSLDDINKGFLETLENLASVGDLPEGKVTSIFTKILCNKSIYNIFVAEVGGQIVGTITLLVEQKIIHTGGKVGHIEDVAVQKGWERQGIGSQLVTKAIEEAKRQKCYKVILDCSEKNVPFYERLGFRKHEVGMRLDIPQNKPTP